jgi:hypothetical protein
VGGEGIRHSEPFRLASYAGAPVRIDASVGTDSHAVWGAILGIAGGVTFEAGADLLIYGFAGSVPGQDGMTPLDDSQQKSFKVVGGTMMVVGAVVGIGGLVMLLNNGTEVKRSSGATSITTARLKLGGPFELTPSGVTF